MKRTSGIAVKVMLVLATLAVGRNAPAQDALMGVPQAKLTAPVMRPVTPTPQSRPPEPTGAFFEFGPFRLHPHLETRYMYAMKLPTRDGRRVASVITTLAPGLLVDLGEHWSFDYSAVWTAYTAQALEDTFDESLGLEGAGELLGWAVSFSESYRKSSPILIETGGQTPQRTWATQVGASHELGNRLLFQTSASLNERYGEVGPDTRDWATANWLIIRVSPRFETGIGLGAGYSDIVAQPDSTNERYQGRFNWSPTDKLKIAIDGGVEMRHSRSSTAKDMRNPILIASLTYQPFVATALTLSSSRTVNTSYFRNQVTEGAGWNLSLSQRLLTRFYLSAIYSHQSNDFVAITADPIVLPEGPADDSVVGTPLISLPGRADRTEIFSARLTTQLFKHWKVAATYQRTDNHSSQTGFTFISTQFGFEVGCRF